MGYKERRAEMISTRAAPHLEPGEQIQTGVIAQTGSPLVVFVPLLIFAARVWTIVVTDRAFLIIGGEQVSRFRRDVMLGKPKGMYHAIQLDRKYWIHRDYYKEVVTADEALRERQSRDNPPTGDH